MKALDIVKILQERLPFYTDAFSSQVALTSLVSLSNVVTGTTTTAHGFAVGDKIHINNAVMPNALAITRAGTTATAISSNKHNLTFGIDTTVTISGADQAEYNGTHVLLSVDSRNQFTFVVADSAVTPATGSPVLEEAIGARTLQGTQVGFNGYFTIQTIPTTTSFAYASTMPDLTAVGTPVLIGPSTRVTRAATLEEIFNNYTKQASEGGRAGVRDLWAFVVLGNVSISKSRSINADNIDTVALGDDPRQRQIKPFSVYVVIPTSKDISGAIARDISEDLSPVLYRSLVGVKPPSGLTESQWSKIVATGHSQASWNGAYYIHEFTFETVADITLEDTALSNDSVAFECFTLDFYVTDNRDAPSVGGTFSL